MVCRTLVEWSCDTSFWKEIISHIREDRTTIKGQLKEHWRRRSWLRLPVISATKPVRITAAATMTETLLLPPETWRSIYLSFEIAIIERVSSAWEQRERGPNWNGPLEAALEDASIVDWPHSVRASMFSLLFVFINLLHSYFLYVVTDFYSW